MRNLKEARFGAPARTSEGLAREVHEFFEELRVVVHVLSVVSHAENLQSKVEDR